MQRQQLMKWSIAVGKIAVFALLVWFVWATLVKAFQDLEHHTWHVAWPWLVAAGIFYILGTLPAGDFWSRLLRDCEQPIGRYTAIRAFLISQVGKYVPGKAMVIVVRAGLVRPLGVSSTLVTACTILETLTNMADGSLIATVVLAPTLAQQWKLLAAALAMFVATGLPILPPVFKLAMRYTGMVKLNPTAVNQMHHIRFSTLGWGWLMMGAGWWVQGLSLWAVLRSLGEWDGGPLTNWPLHTAVVALGVVGGFLAFFPGGIGIREFVIIEVFTPVYGPTNAVVSAILLRFVSVVSDVLVSIILYLVRPPATDYRETVGAEPLEAGSNC